MYCNIKNIDLFDWEIISISYSGVDVITQIMENGSISRYNFPNNKYRKVMCLIFFNCLKSEYMKIEFSSISRFLINEGLIEENERNFNYKISLKDVSIFILGDGFSISTS